MKTSMGWIRRFSWLAALLLMSLSGCGGGGGGGGGETPQPPLQGNYFPLAVGDRWLFDAGPIGPISQRATATRQIDGQTGIVVTTSDPMDGDSDVVFLVSSTGVRQVPGSSADPISLAIGPVELMRFPLTVGSSFEQINKTISMGTDLDGDGRIETADIRSSVQVVGVETVSTPAGSFASSVHLRTTLRVTVRLTSVAQSVTVDSTSDDWYAPGIGPVRSTMHISSEGITETQTLSLMGFRVGTRSSDTTPPSVTTRTPAGTGVQAAPEFVRVDFSEALDADTLAGALKVLDAQGQTLAGQLATGPNHITFWPASPFTSGHYSVQLAPTLSDWFGNALGTVPGWTFEVDATGPQIVSVSPALGALNVPLDVAIIVRFDEAIDPGSVTVHTVSLRGPSGDVTVTVNVSADTVTVRPTEPLQRDAQYQLQLDAHGGPVRDVYGNIGWVPIAARFTTDTGRFGPPVELPQGLMAEAVAVADIDGDGRKDVIAAVGYNANADLAFRLAVYRQQADGQLATTPQWVATRADYVCRPTSMAVGDVDGDGRQEVLVAQTGCGIEIFKGDTAGVLRSVGFLSSAQSYLVRVADFNADGRLDVLAVGWSDSSARLWLQSPGGTLDPAASPAVEYAGWGHLAVGDLNGDALTDFVVTSEQGPADQRVAVVLQRAEGGFAPPVYFGLGDSVGARGVAIGDVDGDGRAELLVAAPGFIAVWRHGSDQTWSRGSNLVAADNTGPLALADINGDGRTDLVVVHTGSQGLGIYLQQTTGGLGAETLYRAYPLQGLPDVMALGDINGDGRTDIVLHNALLLQRPVGLHSQDVRRLPRWVWR